MAREYANIITAIWKDRDFCDLDAAMQRLYLMLATQGDISPVGHLHLRERQWAKLAADTKVSDIVDGLKLLDDRDFVVADFDEDEVLVRAFVRMDKGYTNPKRRQAVIRTAGDVLSLRCRRTLLGEFERVGLPPFLVGDEPLEGPSIALRGPIGGLSKANPLAIEGLSGVGSPTDYAATDDQREGLSKGYRSAPGRVPHSTLPIPESPAPSSPVAGASADPPARAHARRPSLDQQNREARTLGAERAVRAYSAALTKPLTDKTIRQLAVGVDALLKVGYTESDCNAGLVEWGLRAQHPSTLESITSGMFNSGKAPRNGQAPADPGAAFDALRNAGDAKGAGALINVPWRDPSQPLSDHAPAPKWLHAQRVAYIDEHADDIRSALTERAR